MAKTNKINIQISRDAQSKIKEQGRMHEDYTDVILRLIKELIEFRRRVDVKRR